MSPRPAKKMVVKPEVVPNNRPEEENEPYLVQVRDHAGHLLFCYNTRTDSIEYKERGTTYSMSVQVLRQTAYSNVFGDKPVTEMTMQPVVDPFRDGETASEDEDAGFETEEE